MNRKMSKDKKKEEGTTRELHGEEKGRNKEEGETETETERQRQRECTSECNCIQFNAITSLMH